MRPIDATRLVKLVLKERDKIPLETVERYSFGVPSPCKHGQSMRGGIRKVLRLIEQAPTLDLAPKWISVKDRLPPHQAEKVLVINEHGDVRVYALWKREYGNKWTWIDENGEDNHVNNITHWMPLPEAPKEDV